MNTIYEFDVKSTTPNSIIKIIGVGGGGGNAVNYMYEQGIKGVDFILCNTDNQALKTSPIPYKIQLGSALTEGLGAGANPEKGKTAALESKEEIRQILSQNTKMAFITAGMGGGTGTGAAPVVAEICKSLDILTVGIVTMPFQFEGKPKETRAKAGIEELKKHCDTVLVILNNRILEYFGGKTAVKEAFNQADSVLSKAAKAIAEIITVEGLINVDFEDVKTVMKDSGGAVMGSHTCEGENRALRAAEGAINSPLLDNTNIRGAKKILLSIVAGNEDDFQMTELEQITGFIQERAGDDAEVIYGQAYDKSIGNAVSVTVIATGFNLPNQAEKNSSAKPLAQSEKVPTVIDLATDKKTTPVYKPTPIPGTDFFPGDDESDDNISDYFPNPAEVPQANPSVPRPAQIPPITLNGDYEIMPPKASKADIRKKYDSTFGGQQSKPISDYSPEEIKHIREQPAYLRSGGLPAEDTKPTVRLSKVYLVNDNEMSENNRFLHNNVD